MNIFTELTTDTILLDLRSETKPEVIAEMLDVLIAAGRIAADKRAEVLAALMAREAKMSTGMEHGIAIPHAKTDAVARLAAAVARKPAGVDFDAMDGQPSYFFIMTVSPASRSGPHLQFIAEVSRILNDDQVQTQLMQAQSAREVLEIMHRK
ncbi:MAG: PTS sugar transporter subunit IIA [Candidatus Marinimicrobia bacterium]|nr:PTS sugar transporter subunit IIA [Candidatus Neomarinimicrobiota bacterium]